MSTEPVPAGTRRPPLQARSRAALQRGARAYAAIERSFLDAASPYLSEVRRSDPTAALTLVSRMIVAICVQRTLVAQQPGEPSWAWWRAEILGMATAYLASGPA